MTTLLPRARLAELLERCGSLAIGVLGDYALDSYWTADMARAELSREAPLYNRPIVRERYTPGGAANVAWNAAALGADVHALTVLGGDWRGDLLRHALREAGVRLEGALTGDGWATPLFGKVLLSGHGHEQEDARLDFVNTQPLPAAAEGDLLAAVQALLPRLQAVIVADYSPVGVVTPHLREALSDLAASTPKVVFMADSRHDPAALAHMALKPNEVEAARALFPGRDAAAVTPEELAAAAPTLVARAGRPVYITLGGRGCLVCTPGGATYLPAVPADAPSDPVGAGDTFVAAAAAALAAGATPTEAGQLASLAAAVTVRKLRVTGTATPAEILARYDALPQAAPWP
ncbi:MAG TPA: PfkB family carbohydrate kinase [Anaerolineae bacterium]|nr:PfkB family carbohydrate kinase [Anaerolineae bacterium]HOR00063.1 PfkB family carbohydrate kinase [Anaerolineae bacterium]HPL29440.1 PfkB family carbohydrate kinase [Anaerolineae bacterium]